MADDTILSVFQKWEPFLRNCVVAIFALLLGVLLSRLVWVFVEPGGAASNTSTLPRYAAASAASANVSAETNLLTTLNPFDIDSVSSEIIIEEAPETALNLVLLGSRASTNEELASATIRTPDNIARVYTPGEEIISGVILEQVLPDQQVLLRRKGALESLRKLGRGEGLLVLGTDGQPDAPAVATVQSTDPSGPFRVDDGLALFNSMSIQGIRDGNDLTGYRLSARDDGNLMREAGLVPGDILIAFNGDGISDVVPADVRDRLVNGSVVTLSVEREGKTEVVTMAIGR